MEVTTIIILVTDGFGQTACAVCEDWSDTIQICGLQNKGEENAYFESEAYHLRSWCELTINNFEIKVIERTEDFETLWNQTTH